MIKKEEIQSDFIEALKDEVYRLEEEVISLQEENEGLRNLLAEARGFK